MTVDLHVHPILVKGDAGSYATEVEKLLERMDRYGIQKANIVPLIEDSSGLLAFPDEKSTIFCAEFLKKSVEEHRDRFFSMIWLNPYLDMEFLKNIIRKYVIEGNINGVKLLGEMNAADKRLEPLAAFLEENDIPVLYHCSYKTAQKGYSESNPSDIACLARKFPKLRITMAHLRGCMFRGVQIAKKIPNLSIDTGGSYYEDGYLEYALKELGPDRILFGSDYPGRNMAVQMSRIYSVEMTDEDREKLLGCNAVRFLERGNLQVS